MPIHGTEFCILHTERSFSAIADADTKRQSMASITRRMIRGILILAVCWLPLQHPMPQAPYPAFSAVPVAAQDRSRRLALPLIGLAPTPPAAPATLQVFDNRQTGLLLSWTPVADATGYHLEYSSDATTWATLVTLAANISSYVDRNAGVTPLWYRIQTLRAGIASVFTAPVRSTPRTQRVIDLTIAYHAPPDVLASRAPALESLLGHFADAVYEMSNGANQVGTVMMYPDGTNADQADILWLPECHPRAFVGGYATPGQPIFFCDRFISSVDGSLIEDFLNGDYGQRGGGYTLAHEFGHSFYALLDEYDGIPCPEQTSCPASIMRNHWFAIAGDEQTRVSSEGDLGALNFSTRRHVITGTSQEREYAAPGWETLLRTPSARTAVGDVVAKPPVLFHPELFGVAPPEDALRRLNSQRPGRVRAAHYGSCMLRNPSPSPRCGRHPRRCPYSPPTLRCYNWWLSDPRSRFAHLQHHRARPPGVCAGAAPGRYHRHNQLRWHRAGCVPPHHAPHRRGS